VKERAVTLGRNALVGVVSEPAMPPPAERPVVLLLNSGIVHRVGPARMSVRLARRLSEAGHLSVRFDHSGIGDSAPGADGRSWQELWIAEVREVMDELTRTHGARRFVLVGLCSGATTAFRVALADSRVAGAVLMNPQGFDPSPRWNASAKNPGWVRDYLASARRPENWWRALTGRIGYRRLARVLGGAVTHRVARDPAVEAVGTALRAELEALLARDARLLFLFSEGDHSADEFALITRHATAALSHSGLVTASLPGTDHTFTLLAVQDDVLRRIAGWLAALSNP
jgi:alpha-beta hydrolase superfamily lysophospholipase